MESVPTTLLKNQPKNRPISDPTKTHPKPIPHDQIFKSNNLISNGKKNQESSSDKDEFDEV